MSDIREYVLHHDLFCHHDHHADYRAFDADRERYDHRSLLGYAKADLVTAAGPGVDQDGALERLDELWPAIRTTGYGRAVDLTSRELFGLEYAVENYPAIAKALQEAIRGRTAAEVYDEFVHRRARNVWTILDGHYRLGNDATVGDDVYPDSYRFAFRIDSLLSMTDIAPVRELERFTGLPIHRLEDLVDGLNLAIDTFLEMGKLAAIKIGMAYQRDLTVGDPTHAEAEAAFSRIRSRKHFWDGIQQESGAVDAAAGRALGDYLFHSLVQRADDEGLPVQIHTGYLAGNWGSLAGTRAMHLVGVFEKYRSVRFDIFHASWPWGPELGAIAKNYPNVWADMCWAWAMNPAESEATLAGWLDGVPHTKIFAYGADTQLPWCNVGYSLQAKLGVANVLEAKVAAGHYSESTAREVADRILLDNGREFYGLG